MRPRKVVFTGGEPLLRPDLLDLVASLAAADQGHRIQRCLNTNGWHVTPRLAASLVGLIDEVRVSVDALPARNDALRGQGSFAAAMTALELFQDVGFEPKALVTVTSQSLPDLEDLLCLLAGRGVMRVKLNNLRTIGRARCKAAWHVDPSDVRAAVQRAWTRCYPQQQQPPAPAPPARVNCGLGQFLSIMPGGDVFSCHVLTRREFRCGNLREESLLTICRRDGPLGRLAALDVRQLMRRDPGMPPVQCDECLGAVYAISRSSPAWAEILPLLRCH